jgi:hypothetical protein
MLPIPYLILISRNGSPYSEVTVVNLPSSLMIVHSNAFVFSTSLLVVVSRYGFWLKTAKTNSLKSIAIVFPAPYSLNVYNKVVTF